MQNKITEALKNIGITSRFGGIEAKRGEVVLGLYGGEFLYWNFIPAREAEVKAVIAAIVKAA